jgi:hypothetical protein
LTAETGDLYIGINFKRQEAKLKFKDEKMIYGGGDGKERTSKAFDLISSIAS